MRYYFNVQDKLSIQDMLGRDFETAASAVHHAKFLAADIRSLETSERRGMAIRVVRDDGREVHEEIVF